MINLVINFTNFLLQRVYGYAIINFIEVAILQFFVGEPAKDRAPWSRG